MRKLASARAAIAFGLVAAGLSLNSPAQSCTAFQPFRLELISHATTVFRGRVIDYAPRIGNGLATIGFKIVEVYRGDRHDTLKLAWPNETFETPQTWSGPTALIVAAARNHYPPTVSPEPLAVLQSPCSLPFLLEDSAQIARRFAR